MWLAQINGRAQRHYCEPQWSWYPRPLVDYDLWCVLEGVGQLELENQLHALAPGTCMVMRPGDRPHGTHDPGQPLCVLFSHFMPGPELVAMGALDWAPGPVHLPPAEFRLLGALADTLLHFQDTRKDALGAGLALAQILQLLGGAAAGPAGGGALERQEMEARQRLSGVIQALERDLAGPWTVAALGQIAGLSRAQLHRTFTRGYGCAPLEFVTRRRIERARTLLRESGMTLDQIAESLGFTDVHYFSRQFLKHTARRPGAFRKSP